MPSTWASEVIPINNAARITDIHIIVTLALRWVGWLKTVIPFEIASTPVSAEHPAAKARKTKMIGTAG